LNYNVFQNNKKIAIVGLSGTLKTSVGKILSTQLQVPFVDTDTCIERYQQMSVKDIFAKKGELFFRDLESDIIRVFCQNDSVVIATGGGCILRSSNMQLLSKFCKVWLNSSVDSIVDRLRGDTNRPLLQGNMTQLLDEMYSYRLPLYKRYADIIIDNSYMNAQDTAQSILEKLI